MPFVESLNQVPLTFPSRISLGATPAEGEAPKSWIQLGRIGSYVSNRYGKFAITKTDLSQMEFNFKNVTPLPPTQIPVDFDHMSMDPKAPGDGRAAGWLANVELRADGEELWGEVEWTADAAELIRKGAYRFVSPSFAKDHTHKDGKKIGTTLLAAAITNHPFLEGMKAVTLFNFSAMGDLAVDTAPGSAPSRALNLSSVGQHLKFREDAEETPELTAEERGQVFEIVGEEQPDDHFIRVKAANGEPYGWYPERVFEPAPAPNMAKESPMKNATTTIDAMQKIADEHGLNLSRDTAKVMKLAPEPVATAYLEEFGSPAGRPASEVEAAAPVVHNLRTLPGETFVQLTSRISRERQISLSAAISAVSVERPDLAQKYADGDTAA